MSVKMSNYIEVMNTTCGNHTAADDNSNLQIKIDGIEHCRFLVSEKEPTICYPAIPNHSLVQIQPKNAEEKPPYIAIVQYQLRCVETGKNRPREWFFIFFFYF